MMTQNKKVALVRFEHSLKNYAFFNTDVTLEANDVVVCDTARGIAVGKVVCFVNEGTVTYRKANKYIIQKVNMADHFLRLDQANRVKEIEAALEAKKKEFVDTKLVDLMIAENPSLGALVAELHALKKECE